MLCCNLVAAVKVVEWSSNLKRGDRKTLLEQVPEIKGVRDVTDHTDNENAYYK